MKPFSCLKITTKVILSICAVVFVVLTFVKTQAFAADAVFKQINFHGKLTNLNVLSISEESYKDVFRVFWSINNHERKEVKVVNY